LEPPKRLGKEAGNVFTETSRVWPIAGINPGTEERLTTGSPELDRVLGGGLVPGSVVLIGGDPGIGKSTLLLQAANFLAGTQKVLYVSGEESPNQLRLRAERLGVAAPELYILTETNLMQIEAHLALETPGAVIIDSIQTMYLPDLSSVPGSVAQVRECAGRIIRWAKEHNVPVFLVGHVTKSGELAGPRVLEHMVDTVVYFEGERQQAFRVLRAVKNRFGSTNEIGVFQMSSSGLIPVSNPSEIFLAQRPAGASGSQVVASMEGSRPVLLEVQALVSPSGFGNPRRLTAGLDFNRVLLMLAVLEKRQGLELSSQDVYVNIAGGVKVDETALDLGICAAVVSSFKNRAVEPYTLVLGEVGLTGEVRSIGQVEARLAEAEKLGFKRAVLPLGNLKQLSGKRAGIKLLGVATVGETLELIFT